MLDGAVRRNRQNKILLYALMAKLVDAPDLGSGSARIEGSTPSRGTDYVLMAKLVDAPVSDAGPK